MPARDEAATTPVKLGRYELITRIGEGGMAEVHLARQRGPHGFEKLVVVKLVHQRLATQKAFVDMLLDEARVAALVKHPNVVDIYDLGQVDNQYFIAMEYLEGEPLLAVLKAGRDGRRLDPGSTARLIADTAEGLEAAHELRSMSGQPLGLVHHDISLGNIVVLHNGQVKLVDFGVAKAESIAVANNVVQGKFSYMAPEKLRGSAGDRRSDIFSLGAVMWEALTLRRLFRGNDEKDTMRQVLELPIQPPSSVNPDVPAAFDRICLKALDRDPAARYPTALAMAKDLEAALRALGYSGKNEQIARYMTETFAERISARRQLIHQVTSAEAPSASVVEAAFAPGQMATGSTRLITPLPLAPATAGPTGTATSPSRSIAASALPGLPSLAGPTAGTAPATASGSAERPKLPLPKLTSTLRPPVLPGGALPKVVPAVVGPAGQGAASAAAAEPAGQGATSTPPVAPAAPAAPAPATPAPVAQAVTPAPVAQAVTPAPVAQAVTPAPVAQAVTPAPVAPAAPAATASSDGSPEPASTSGSAATDAAPRPAAPTDAGADGVAEGPAETAAAPTEGAPRGAAPPPVPAAAPTDGAPRAAAPPALPATAVREAKAPKDSKDSKDSKDPKDPKDAVPLVVASATASGGVRALENSTGGRDVLAGWAWTTGAVNAIPAEHGEPEPAPPAASRKRLLLMIGGAMGLAAVITLGALVFGGGGKKPPNGAVAGHEDDAGAAEAPPSIAAAPTPDQPAAADAGEVGATAAGGGSAVAAVAATGAEPALDAAPQPTIPAPVDAAAEVAVARTPGAGAGGASGDAGAAPTGPRIAATTPAGERNRIPGDAGSRTAAATATTTAKPDKPPKADAKGAAKGDPAGKVVKTTRPDESTKAGKSTGGKAEAEPLYKSGLQQFVRGDTKGALATLRKASAADPSFPPTWRGLGLCYEKLGDKGQAKAAFERYLKLAPLASDAAQVRGRISRLGS